MLEQKPTCINKYRSDPTFTPHRMLLLEQTITHYSELEAILETTYSSIFLKT